MGCNGGGWWWRACGIIHVMRSFSLAVVATSSAWRFRRFRASCSKTKSSARHALPPRPPPRPPRTDRPPHPAPRLPPRLPLPRRPRAFPRPPAHSPLRSRSAPLPQTIPRPPVRPPSMSHTSLLRLRPRTPRRPGTCRPYSKGDQRAPSDPWQLSPRSFRLGAPLYHLPISPYKTSPTSRHRLRRPGVLSLRCSFAWCRCPGWW